MKTLPVLFMFCTLSLPLPASAATIHVPADQPTIQAGIDAAVDGDIVLVADGTYLGHGNQEIEFDGKAVLLTSANGRDHCTIDLQDHWGFKCNSGEGPGTVIQGFTIRNGYGSWDGGAIYCGDASPRILDNAFINNAAPSGAGGAISCRSTTLVMGNQFIGNWCDDSGGALFLVLGSPVVMNNVFVDNEALIGGGAISCWGGTARIINNLIVGNRQFWQGNDIGGGGIASYADGNPEIINCTFVDNEAQGNNLGGAIFIGDFSSATVLNSILWGNSPNEIGGIYTGTITVNHSCVVGGWTGTGNLDLDPLFATGPDGDYYLSQVAAGQAEDSPCVDTGDQLSELIDGTTRTDLVPDAGIVNMGFHYPFPTARIRLVTGLGPGYDNPPLVRVYFPLDDGPMEYEFSAYSPTHYGTNVACGDVDGDVIDEILTGAGPGDIYGPHVRGFNRGGSTLPGLNFLAYGTNKYGVNVATGDLDADGRDEIITGAGPGAVFGPHVRGWVYNGPSGVAPYPGVSYFAYGTPKWGVNVSAGDIDGDGFDEIVTGAGPGAVYGPHVRGWDVDGGTVAAAIPAVSFLAYGTQKFGVNVTCGDVDGDGMDEIVTGAGPGALFGPHIRGWNYDGASVTPLPGFSFFAWDTEPLHFGVNVCAVTDLNNDGRDELVAGRGPDPDADTEVKVFIYDGTAVSLWLSLEAYSGLTHGTSVAAGRF